ncbi:hypothetical protein [Mycoplasmoides fastidiosum]|nr:hypothetical protein [Mycoplasmoides fastidiosum]UUD37850.1 hypothetical protein NPA10_00430 [Mycoplasmoides fastidiosum]
MTWLSLGLLSTVTLAACAPKITNRFLRNEMNKSGLKNLSNEDLVQKLTNNYKRSEFKDLKFSDNFYKPSQLGKISDLFSEFSEFGYDIDLNFLLNSFVYKESITKLSTPDITNDILDNLRFLTFLEPNIAIDFEKLDLQFQLEHLSKTQSILNNFRLVFELTNSDDNEFKLFNKIVIQPNSKVQITVLAEQVNVEPWYRKSNTYEGDIEKYFSSWKLSRRSEPINVDVAYLQKFVYDSAKLNEQSAISSRANVSSDETNNFLQVDDLEVLIHRSFAHNIYYTQINESYDFKNIYEEATQKINRLTPEQIKADLINNEININRIYYANVARDVDSILKYFTTPNIRQNNGELYSILDLLYFNPTKESKETLLNNFDIPNFARNILINIFTPENGETLPPLEQIYAFIDALLNNDFYSYVFKYLDIQIIWKQDPVINLTNPEAPKVSMEYTKKITFKKDLAFALKGQGQYNGKLIDYDVTKLFNLTKFLDALGFPLTGNNSASGILSTLMENLKLDDLKIPANTSVAMTYRVDNGNLLLDMPGTFDVNIVPNFTLGWQIDQAHVSIDLSGLYPLLMSIFEKFNQFQTRLNNTDFLGLIGLPGLVTKAQAGDLKSLFELLTYFYVPHSQSKSEWINKNETILTSEQLASRVKRPIELLFEEFVRQPFVLTNSHIGAGVSSAFYEIPKTINSVPLYSASASDPNTYQINSELDLETLSTFAPAADIARSGINYQNPDLFQIVWKSGYEKTQIDSYNTFFSQESTTIDNGGRDIAYQKILESVQSDNDVNQDLINRLQAAAKTNYHNPLNQDIIPQISINKIPLLQAVEKILQQPLVPNSRLAKSPSILKALQTLISSIVELDAYVITTTYPSNSNQFGKDSNGKYSAKIEMIKSIYFNFISPKINFDNLKFPDASTIFKEI